MIRSTFKAILLYASFTLVLSHCSIVDLDSRPSTIEKESLSKEDILRRDIIKYASKQLGRPYRYAGRDPRGFDCSGFTHYVLKNFEIPLSTSSRSQGKEGQSITVKKAKQGDLIFFRRSKAGRIFHVAMVVSNDDEGLKVIHSTSRGVVVDNVSKSKYWKPKVSAARDVIGG